MEQHIYWKIGEGNIMFWWDQWLLSGPIYPQLVQSPKAKNTKVKEFWENNRWDFETLEEVIHRHLVEEIRSVYIQILETTRINLYGSFIPVANSPYHRFPGAPTKGRNLNHYNSI